MQRNRKYKFNICNFSKKKTLYTRVFIILLYKNNNNDIIKGYETLYIF